MNCQTLSPRISQKIASAIAALNSEASEETKLLELARAEVDKLGLSEFARRSDAFKARGVIYLTPEARFSHLLALLEGANLGRALNKAMDDIENNNPDLADALPKNYGAVGDDILRELIKTLAPLNIDGDAFGRVYEYFMGNFAMQEMQKGGEFYTPASIVRLIVEIIEPYHSRILDPACGSGGMFVHSADFVRAHRHAPERELSIFGIEKVTETQRLARMNIAVHGLGGTIREANAYYEVAGKSNCSSARTKMR